MCWCMFITFDVEVFGCETNCSIAWVPTSVRMVVVNRELCAMLRGSLDVEGSLGENGCMYMYG